MVTSSYVIVIEGEVDPACAVVFAPADVTVGGGRTTVQTEAIDQPGLHGILDRVADLGLTLLSVTTTEMAVETASARRSARRT
jgi:hypothetical protein